MAWWCLEPGSWLPPEGSRVRSWKLYRWAMEWGQWWGSSARNCDHLHPCLADPRGVCPDGCLLPASVLHQGPLGRGCPGRGAAPRPAGPCLSTGGRLMHPRDVQPGGYGCLHAAMGTGSRGTGVSQVSKPSGLSFARLVPARSVPPAPREVSAPLFARGRVGAKPCETRRGGCSYPPSRSAGLSHGQGSVWLPHNKMRSPI